MVSLPHFIRVLWRFLRPELEELIVYSSVVIIFGFVAFYQAVLRDSKQTEDFAEVLSATQDKFAFITNGGDIAAYIFTFGTWFIIGTIVYMIAWFLVSFWSGAFHDIQVSNSYIHPRSFRKSDYWFTVLARAILRGSAAISLVFYGSLWIATLAPSWLANFRNVFASSANSGIALNLLLVIIGIFLSLHIAALLLRVVLLRSKYFYQK